MAKKKTTEQDLIDAGWVKVGENLVRDQWRHAQGKPDDIVDFKEACRRWAIGRLPTKRAPGHVYF